MKQKREKHGMHHHPAYAVWCTMKVRCSSTTGGDYRLYGARGIKVCQSWKESFSAFWVDMGPTYQPGSHLGRKDKDGDYTPENCHWIKSGPNQAGRRGLHSIETPWGPLTVSEAARKAGLTPSCLHQRLFDKWTIERALSTPMRKRKEHNS